MQPAARRLLTDWRRALRDAEALAGHTGWIEYLFLALALGGAHWFLGEEPDWRVPLLLVAAVPVVRLAAETVGRRRAVRSLDALLYERRVIFVGVNERTLAAQRELCHRAGPVEVVGFVDEPARRRDDVLWLGELSAFADIVRGEVVDAVIVALPLRSHYDDITRIIKICETHGITVHFLLDLFGSLRGDTKIGLGADGVTTLTMHTAPIDGVQLRLKHVLDRLLAALGLVAISPLLALAAIAIKLEDGGSVFFTQERVGHNKRPFRMLKLRTMVADAEQRLAALEVQNERDGAAFKITNDPRVSRVGRLLRKYSIDELPQLFNVLRGEMSLVGPRPLSLRDYGRLPMDWQRRRFSMRPGLTCYWQVRGRHRTTFVEWMQMDLEYIDRWDLLEDFKILLLTVPEVLRGGGA